MVVTRSTSGTTKKTNTKIAVNQQTGKVETINWPAMEIAQCIFLEEAFLKKYREKFPHIQITSEVIRAGEKEWISISDNEKSPYVAEAEKRLAEFVDAYRQNSIMMVTRAKSGTSKKVNTKNVVKQHQLAKRASKKTSAKERRLLDRALDIFVLDTFLSEYLEKHPDAPPSVIAHAGEDRWHSMSDRDKAPYVELAKKRDAEEHEIYRKMKKGEYQNAELFQQFLEFMKSNTSASEAQSAKDSSSSSSNNHSSPNMDPFSQDPFAF